MTSPPVRRSELPELWHFAISHFTEKARWALDYKRIPHRRRLLFLDYPVRVPLRTGQGSLPVLFWDGRSVCDSSEIIRFLEERVPAPPLYPEEPEARERALALEDFFDEELGPHIRAVVVQAAFDHGPDATVALFAMARPERDRRRMRALFPVFRRVYAFRHRMLGGRVALGRRKIAIALARLAAELGPSGYLVGDRFTVADLTAAALLYPLAMPPEYPYQPPKRYVELLTGSIDAEGADLARDYVTRIYAEHRGVSAAVDA